MRLASFYSALKRSDRESLIREELIDLDRLKFSKSSKESLAGLIFSPKAERKLRIEGCASYRILRHDLS